LSAPLTIHTGHPALASQQLHSYFQLPVMEVGRSLPPLPLLRELRTISARYPHERLSEPLRQGGSLSTERSGCGRCVNGPSRAQAPNFDTGRETELGMGLLRH
jgi:hypothetical protein